MTQLALLLFSSLALTLAVDCNSLNPTIRNESDYAAFTCVSGTGQSLFVLPDPGLTVNWTFPTIRQLVNFRVYSGPGANGRNSTVTVGLPSLTKVLGLISAIADNFGRLTVTMPLLESVLTTFDVFANLGGVIDYMSFGGNSSSGLSVFGLTQLRSYDAINGSNSVIGLLELPRVSYLQSLTVIGQSRFDRFLLNDGATLNPVLATIGPIVVGTADIYLWPTMTDFVASRIAVMTSFTVNNGCVRNVYLNPARLGTQPMVVTGQLLIQLGAANVLNVVDRVVVGPVVSMGALTLALRGLVTSIVINEGGTTPLTVFGAVNINSNHVATIVRNITVERLIAADSFSLTPNPGVFQNVTINAPNTCVGLIINRDLTINTAQASAFVTLPVTVNGVARVRGRIIVTASGPLAGVIVDTGGESCPSLQIESSVQVSTLAVAGLLNVSVALRRVSSIAGAVTVTSVSPTHKGLVITPRMGATMAILGVIQITSSGALTNYLSPVRIGPLSECRSVFVDATSGGKVELVELTSRPNDAFFLKGNLAVTASVAGSYIYNVTASTLKRVGGSVLLTAASPAQIDTVGLLGTAASAFDVDGSITIRVDGAIRLLQLRFLQTISGAVSVSGAGSILNLNLLGATASAVQILGDLNISSVSVTGVMKNIIIGPLSLVTGQVYIGQNFDAVQLNSAGGPSLNIGGDLTVGSGALDGISGAVTVYNLVSVQNLLLTTSSTALVNGAVRIQGSSSESLLVNGALSVYVSRQLAARSLSVTDISRVTGLASVYALENGTIVSLGPLSINGRPVNRVGNRLYDNVTRDANDPSCVNACSGRGDESISFAACDTIPATACTCWAGNNGSFCSQAGCSVNDASCWCSCTPWSNWIAVSDFAWNRTRNCTGVSSCPKVELKGSVYCALGSQFEVQGQTLTSHRMCNAVAVCAAVGLQYEASVPTAQQNRVCANTTVCNVTTSYEIVAATATSDRTCANLTLPCGVGFVEATKPTATTDRVCRACVGAECFCKTCAVGEFVKVPCNAPALGDTVCAACSRCTAAKYQQAPCVNGVDTVCSNVTFCRLGLEFIVQPATLTSDTVCKAFQECGDNFYESVRNTTTSDRECSALSQCLNVDGFFEQSPPSKSSNRICARMTACSVVQYQVRAANATGNTICAALTTCVPGKYIQVPPTLTSDQLCAPCTLGVNYTDVSNLPACLPVSQCPPGSSSSGAPATLSSNAGCTPCAFGQFQNLPGQLSCKPVRVCAAGVEFAYTAATPSSDAVCKALRVCALGERYESRSPTATTDRVCAVVSECLGGFEYVVAPPTLLSDRVCAAFTECVFGSQFMTQEATATSDRVCQAYRAACAFPMQFEAFPGNETADVVCQPVTKCNVSVEFQSRVPVPDRDAQCSPLLQCASNEYEVVAPTLTSDRRCSFREQMSTTSTSSSTFTFTSAPATPREGPNVTSTAASSASASSSTLRTGVVAGVSAVVGLFLLLLALVLSRRWRVARDQRKAKQGSLGGVFAVSRAQISAVMANPAFIQLAEKAERAVIPRRSPQDEVDVGFAAPAIAASIEQPPAPFKDNTDATVPSSQRPERLPPQHQQFAMVGMNPMMMYAMQQQQLQQRLVQTALQKHNQRLYRAAAGDGAAGGARFAVSPTISEIPGVVSVSPQSTQGPHAGYLEIGLDAEN